MISLVEQPRIFVDLFYKMRDALFRATLYDPDISSLVADKLLNKSCGRDAKFKAGQLLALLRKHPEESGGERLQRLGKLLLEYESMCVYEIQKVILDDFNFFFSETPITNDANKEELVRALFVLGEAYNKNFLLTSRWQIQNTNIFSEKLLFQIFFAIITMGIKEFKLIDWFSFDELTSLLSDCSRKGLISYQYSSDDINRRIVQKHRFSVSINDLKTDDFRTIVEKHNSVWDKAMEIDTECVMTEGNDKLKYAIQNNPYETPPEALDTLENVETSLLDDSEDIYVGGQALLQSIVT